MTFDTLNALSKENTLSYSSTDELDEVLKLFDMHNLISTLSERGHIFVNSLAMLVSSLDWHGHKRHLFEALPYIKGREIDLLDIINTMSNLGFEVHQRQININDINDRMTPCLFIPSIEHATPIVLLDRVGDVFHGFDTMSQQRVEFEARNIVGLSYFFEKINLEHLEMDKKAARSAGLSWFRMLLKRFRPIITEIIIASFLVNLLSLAMPLFSMLIYDKVIASGSKDILWKLIIGVLLTISAEFTLRMIRLKSIVWLGIRLNNIVSNTIFERLLFMKASYTEGASISSQISRIKAFESVKHFFTGPLFSVVIEIPFTFIMVIVIWMISGPLVYIPIVVICLYIIILLYFNSKIKLSMKQASLASANSQQFSMETLIKIQSLYTNGLSNKWHTKYKDKLGDSAYASFKSSIVAAQIDILAHAISILSGVAIITYGVDLIWDQQITTGALVATMILIWRILGPLQTLSSVLPRLEQLKTSIDQINKLIDIELERKLMSGAVPIDYLKGDISINNLGLRYSIEFEPVFIGFDLEIKAGEIVAITGANGSGKSSILKLINGLYKSQTGTVKIDNIHIKQFDPAELRNYIRYLPQSPNFFEGTIKENLLLANPLATDQEITDALKDVGIMDDIQNMQNGIETVIFSSNPALPNGFVYALNFARILIKKGNILLLDELPNASLNEEIGRLYKKILQEYRGKKTIIFISQRNDFISFADKVVLMKTANKPVIMGVQDFVSKNEAK